MGGGCMLSSGEMILGILTVLGGLFGMMLSFYILLCFIQWVSDVWDEKRWYVWKEWFNYDSYSNSRYRNGNIIRICHLWNLYGNMGGV